MYSTQGRASAVFRLWRIIKGSCVLCGLSQIVERARPRKSVTGSVAYFDRFLLFSASRRTNGRPPRGNGRKPRKSIKRRQAKGCAAVGVSVSPRPTQSDSIPLERLGREGAEKARSNPPCTLRAPGEAVSVLPQTRHFSTYKKIKADIDSMPVTIGRKRLLRVFKVANSGYSIFRKRC